MITSQQVEQFSSALSDNRVRFQLSPHLWDAFAQTFPNETTGGMNRQILHEVVVALQNQGFEVPKSRRSYNRDGFPPLPNWIKRPQTEKQKSFSPEEHLWARELVFLASVSHLAKADLWLLLDAWLKKRRGQKMVELPIKERSLEVFGEEKVLDGLIKTKFFKDGLITLEDLSCFPVYEPLPQNAGPVGSKGRACIVVENPATAWTIAQWNMRSGHYSCVIYGGGNRFSGMWGGLIPLQREYGFQEVAYFGDIDVNGFSIPYRAWREIRETGMFGFKLEEWLYEIAAAKADEVALRIEPDGKSLPTDVAEWMPPWLRERVGFLLLKHSRVPQEIVTVADLPVQMG